MQAAPSSATPASSIDSPEAIAADLAAVARISAVPRILTLLCEHTGMGFAAVARVTDGTWVACAVEDRIGFGLRPGGQLEIGTTLCRESRAQRAPVVIDHASEDPVYRDHHTPRLYGLQSYLSVPIVCADGRYFGNLCAIDRQPAAISDPKTVRLFTALADIIATQLTADEAFDVAQAEVLQARTTGELREQFIAVLGHDLRNPLSVVGAAAELLRRRGPDGDRRLGDQLRATTRRMGRLIDNLLDFARTRLGTGIGVDIQPVEHLERALLAVVDEARAGHPQARIVDDIEPIGPAACDPLRLQQLLSNILGNAVQHSAAGEPIHVQVRRRDGELHLWVANRGTPIAPENLQQIFQPYWRLAGSKPGGGLGLGLFICAEIAKAHGGTIAARSSAEEGTVFSLRLPLGSVATLG